MPVVIVDEVAREGAALKGTMLDYLDPQARSHWFGHGYSSAVGGVSRLPEQSMMASPVETVKPMAFTLMPPAEA